jgi:hypothetical protein
MSDKSCYGSNGPTSWCRDTDGLGIRHVRPRNSVIRSPRRSVASRHNCALPARCPGESLGDQL